MNKTLLAPRTRTWWASRRVALCRWEGQTLLRTPSMTRNRTQSPLAPPVPGPLPGPVPPLSRQHWEEQDEPAQEVQTHGGPQLSPGEGFAPCSSGFSLLGDLGLRHGRAKAKVEPCCASSDISPPPNSNTSSLFRVPGNGLAGGRVILKRVDPARRACGGGTEDVLGWWGLRCPRPLWALVRASRQRITLEELPLKTATAAVGVGRKGWWAQARGPRRRKPRCSRKRR